MNKAILMSIKPQYVCDILNGKKTIEVRKKFPKDFRGWVYIYCTKGTPRDRFYCWSTWKFGKVVARFWCDNVLDIKYNAGEYFVGGVTIHKKSCVDLNEMNNYLKCKDGYAIIITQLEIFNKPKELGEFKKYGMINFLFNNCGDNWVDDNWNELLYLSKPPQNYCYIEVE